MDVNLALRAFVRTVEKGSVTGAARDLEGVVARFELARAGDEGERQVVAEDGIADGDVRIGIHGGAIIASGADGASG